jgi:UDP-GlcNAc:undecaprenyl-phosphate GlcNAc-1-phosphate transferase
LVAICSLAALFAAFGIYGESRQFSEAFMFYTFMLCFTFYAVVLSYIWRITSFIKKRLGKEGINVALDR